MTSSRPVPHTVLFDLGRVLLDWDPRYYYARHFGGRDADLEHFVRHVIAMEWIGEMDAGKPTAQAVAERQSLHPEHARLIGLWEEGWPHMLRGEIEDSVAIVHQLKARGVRLYALTNFSTETFPIALRRYASLGLFEDIVVSGEVGLIKPDPRIFAHAIAQCGLEPARTVFVDDNMANVEAGRAAGMAALHFTSPTRLRDELAALGLAL